MLLRIARNYGKLPNFAFRVHHRKLTRRENLTIRYEPARLRPIDECFREPLLELIRLIIETTASHWRMVQNFNF